MREIKFKYLANVEGVDGEIDWGEKVMTLDEIGWGEWEDYLSACFTSYPDNIYKLQNTGLKDKNGVDIYEGDLVQWDEGLHFYGKQGLEEVKWEGGYWSIMSVDKEDFWVVFCEDECKVIGNIYQNKDLLS